MASKSNYFSHDYAPINDAKISLMLRDYKSSGYGMYWRIVEILHSENTHKLELRPINISLIAHQVFEDFDTVKEFIRKCITEYELFDCEDNFISSKRVFRNIEHQSAISSKRAEAGSKGGKARAASEAQNRGGNTSPSLNTTTALSDSFHDPTTIPTQANATNVQANASFAQANAAFSQAKSSNIFPLKNKEDSSLTLGKEGREESKGVWGKKGVGDSNFLKIQTEVGNVSAEPSSAIAHLRNARRGREEARQFDERSGNGILPDFTHSGLPDVQGSA